MERRELRFKNLNDALAELKTLEAGPVETTGNWSFYQILDHCAEDTETSMKGLPKPLPWLLKATMGKYMKGKMLKAGFMNSGIRGGKIEPKQGNEKEAFARLRKAIAQFQTLPDSPLDHYFYGKSTKTDCEKLIAYHMANHLGFARPKK